MKKSFFCLVVLVLVFFVAMPVYSQKASEAELYYVNVPIVKAYQHNDGYYIVYRRANMQMAGAFIPHKWFSPTDGRGEVRRINTRVNPYMSVFTKNGKFEYVKVSLPVNNSHHPVWGLFQNPSEYDGKFTNETLELEF